MTVSLVIIVVLMLAVIFVNGWTDAPNAIATAVSTRVITPSAAVKMAVVMNFLGVLIMTVISPKVANTLSKMIVINPGQEGEALTVLAAGMFSIVIWATAAWYFGIPTSESHALIAGVTGAALALGGFSSVSKEQWMLVLLGLVISSVLGFLSGWLSVKGIEKVFRRVRRRTAGKFFHFGEMAAAAMMAFLHGAQDGQKFIGIFLLGIYYYGITEPGFAFSVTPGADGTFPVPPWLIVLCSVVMGIGTSVGGYRIIKAVGMDMVKLQKYQGFASDMAASFCLLLSTLTGVPVSTTHTKTTAIMGVGASKRLSAVNWIVARDMVLAWVLTFPGCGLISFLMAKLFLKLF
ncbi:MAG: inorganic phosphate transporter [Clostridiales bacterium]|nr:inorganic phosphate transporter [Clostridiales bacterium]